MYILLPTNTTTLYGDTWEHDARSAFSITPRGATRQSDTSQMGQPYPALSSFNNLLRRRICFYVACINNFAVEISLIYFMEI